MDIHRLVRADPSGNKTAIVFDAVAPEYMREVAAIIQAEFPDTEQVMFVQKRENSIHGQMAGGEFCGNAARALGYVLAGGKESQQIFTMSGLNLPVMVEVKPGYAKLKMQTALKREKMILGNADVSIVHLEGISHAVLFSEHPLFAFLKEYAARPDRSHTIMHVLNDLGIASRPACGLIFVEKSNAVFQITPYVYVRDIETLYAEMACASGSVAVASLVMDSLSREAANISLQQPSNENLHVSLQPSGHLLHAEVAGSMRILSDGGVDDLEDVHPLFSVARKVVGL